mmetsp:Transcript_1889/g.2528  ORF Transcript_1889/g.2528 Transcript_1889/m.2528 type:complete len:84 (+) Transcript_1889:359-610(+)
MPLWSFNLATEPGSGVRGSKLEVLNQVLIYLIHPRGGALQRFRRTELLTALKEEREAAKRWEVKEKKPSRSGRCERSVMPCRK